jgi:non-ribosomal peptide synthase protein (TIGR01720 family)
VFNYLGHWDARSAEAGDGLARRMRAPLGSDHDPAEPATHALDVSAAVHDGRLEVSFSHQPDRYDRAAVESLAAAFGQALAQIARECRDIAR